MPLRKMRACMAAAGRRRCRQLAETLQVMAVAAQSDEKGIRQLLDELRRGANPGTAERDDGERLVVLTDDL